MYAAWTYVDSRRGNTIVSGGRRHPCRRRRRWYSRGRETINRTERRSKRIEGETNAL